MAKRFEEFLEANKSPETLQVYVNTTFAETWEERGSVVDDGTLLARREKYGPKVPSPAALLVASVDVQGDRIELETVAYGPGEESWQMDYRVLMGDPATDQLWEELDIYLLTSWDHELGVQLPIAAAGIDSGGHHTQEVYRFVKPRLFRRVYAVKGSNKRGAPIIGRYSIVRPPGVRVFPIGTDTAKERIQSRLRLLEPGPRHMHFPVERDEAYFKQLTSERPVRRFRYGQPYIQWVKKPGVRNEGLDLRVYNLAIMMSLNANLDRMWKALQEKAKAREEGKAEPPAARPAEERRDVATPGAAERRAIRAESPRGPFVRSRGRKWQVKNW